MKNEAASLMNNENQPKLFTIHHLLLIQLHSTGVLKTQHNVRIKQELNAKKHT